MADPTATSKSLAREIRDRAEKCGVSINSIVKAAGVSGNTIWRWENMVGAPRQETVDAIMIQLARAEASATA